MFLEACYLINNKQRKKVKNKKVTKSKLLTHLWMESCISNYSIADNLQPDELLTYYQHIEKLIYAGYWINSNRENKKKLKT